jgi:hypothetical protein
MLFVITKKSPVTVRCTVKKITLFFKHLMTGLRYPKNEQIQIQGAKFIILKKVNKDKFEYKRWDSLFRYENIEKHPFIGPQTK